MRIEAGNSVEFFRRLLGVFAACAFLRDDMHNDRTVEILDAVECFDQFRQFVPVDGAYVAQSHFFKKNTGHKQAFGCFFKFLDSADDTASAGHALHRHFCKRLEMVVAAPRDDAVEIVRNGADRFRNRHFIVVHNDDQVPAAGADIVQRLKRKPADQGAVADDGDHMFAAVACVACGGESHCGGNCGAGMAAAETVEFGFFPQGKTGKPVVRTDRMETVSPSGQKLVDIALMPYVPYDFIFRHIEYAVKGDSQFDDSEIRGKMPAIFGDGVDNRFPEFRTECSQLPGSQSLQVFGRTDIIQYFFVHILSFPSVKRVHFAVICYKIAYFLNISFYFSKKSNCRACFVCYIPLSN